MYLYAFLRYREGKSGSAKVPARTKLVRAQQVLYRKNLGSSILGYVHLLQGLYGAFKRIYCGVDLPLCRKTPE
jgi:hypothetical protein